MENITAAPGAVTSLLLLLLRLLRLLLIHKEDVTNGSTEERRLEQNKCRHIKGDFQHLSESNLSGSGFVAPVRAISAGQRV